MRGIVESGGNMKNRFCRENNLPYTTGIWYSVLRMSIAFWVTGLAIATSPSLFAQTSMRPLGIAAFNLAWAGTADDFEEHLRVCSAPTVNWCDARIKYGDHSAAEKARARRCQNSFDAAAGGREKARMVAPCNAYKLNQPVVERDARVSYQQKLDGLKKTVGDLITLEKVSVFAFQEVKNEETINEILGQYAGRFHVCTAPHDAFQTVGFAWDSQIYGEPASCMPQPNLAIVENPQDATSRHLRPGLALELMVNGSPLTILNVHLKSGCANLMTRGGFKGHKLTDADQACAALNRQVPQLENWIESVAAQSPRFIVLGDFNRKLDEEAAADVAPDKVRTDGSLPSTPNKMGQDGAVKSQYLWQEIADAEPSNAMVYQIPLSPENTGITGCSGFAGLDHILVSQALKDAQGTNVVSSKKTKVFHVKGQKIKTSDHCPRITTLLF